MESTISKSIIVFTAHEINVVIFTFQYLDVISLYEDCLRDLVYPSAHCTYVFAGLSVNAASVTHYITHTADGQFKVFHGPSRNGKCRNPTKPAIVLRVNVHLYIN